MIKLFVDGCSLGNPGDAGIGLVIYKNGKVIKKLSKYIGETTNNFAEYLSLIFGLQEILSLRERPVYVYMDSELVVNQIKGYYKIKNKILYPLNFLVKHLISLIGECKILYTSRKNNKLADSLAKEGAKSRKN